MEAEFVAFQDQEQEQEELIKPYATKKEQNGETTFLQWQDIGLREEVYKGIIDNGFEFPSQIQYRAIPQIAANPNRDCLFQAKSGTGKTAVFILSILNSLKLQENGDFLPQSCIVVAPTRELAHQIFLAFRNLSSGFIQIPVRISCYFGGLPLYEGKQQLKGLQTPHIIVGALGRLRHLVSESLIRTENVRHFVVDECDSIAENPSNFEDLKYLLRNTPLDKQILMFTATLTQSTCDNCLSVMRKAQKPFVLQLDTKKVNLRHLKHFCKQMQQKEKIEILFYLLDHVPFNQVIIFANTIQKCQGLTELLRLQLFNPICINSTLPQMERLENYDMFKSNGCRIMVATDILGRGIDIEKVNLVINYDFPDSAVKYMHRAARAGRFGKAGTVISFMRVPSSEDTHLNSDLSVYYELVQSYQVHIGDISEAFASIEIF